MPVNKMKARSLRVISLLTLAFFLVNQSAFAAPAAGIEIATGRETPGFLQIDIPEDLATLDDIYEAPPSPDPKLILQIQNAHANYGAQQKIKALLAHLNKSYDINTIFVEGSSKPLDPDYLKFFPDSERNLKLADLFARDGELTGAELYLIEAGSQKIKAEGIEDADLYRANYEALKKVFGAEVIVDKYVSGIESRLETLSSKISSPDMRRMLSEWKKFEKGRREFMPYIRSLADASKQVLKLDLESLFAQVAWPQITRLLVLQELEKEMNAERALEEKDRLVKFLSDKGFSKDLIQAIENFKDQHISVTRKGQGGAPEALQPRYLLERLAAEAGPKGFQFSDYPYFSVHAGYLILKSELDSIALFTEINRLFTEILDQLAETKNQKTLLSIYRDEELVRKLLNLELTRSDWTEAEVKRPELVMDSMVARLKELGRSVNAELNLSDTEFETKRVNGKFRSGVTEVYKAAYSFYDYARKREEVFYEKMSQVMSNKAETKAVLITGGFHTDGVSELLREHEINYGILTPRLFEKSNENLYRAVMLQKQERPFSISYLEAIPQLISLAAQFDQGVIPADRIASALAKIMETDRTSLERAVAIFNASIAAKKNGVSLSPAGKDSQGKPLYQVNQGEVVEIQVGDVSVQTGSLDQLPQIDIASDISRSEARGFDRVFKSGLFQTPVFLTALLAASALFFGVAQSLAGDLVVRFTDFVKVGPTNYMAVVSVENVGTNWVSGILKFQQTDDLRSPWQDGKTIMQDALVGPGQQLSTPVIVGSDADSAFLRVGGTETVTNAPAAQGVAVGPRSELRAAEVVTDQAIVLEGLRNSIKDYLETNLITVQNFLNILGKYEDPGAYKKLIRENLDRIDSPLEQLAVDKISMLQDRRGAVYLWLGKLGQHLPDDLDQFPRIPVDEGLWNEIKERMQLDGIVPQALEMTRAMRSLMAKEDSEITGQDISKVHSLASTALKGLVQIRASARSEMRGLNRVLMASLLAATALAFGIAQSLAADLVVTFTDFVKVGPTNFMAVVSVENVGTNWVHSVLKMQETGSLTTTNWQDVATIMDGTIGPDSQVAAPIIVGSDASRSFFRVTGTEAVTNAPAASRSEMRGEKVVSAIRGVLEPAGIFFAQFYAQFGSILMLPNVIGMFIARLLGFEFQRATTLRTPPQELKGAQLYDVLRAREGRSRSEVREGIVLNESELARVVEIFTSVPPGADGASAIRVWKDSFVIDNTTGDLFNGLVDLRLPAEYQAQKDQILEDARARVARSEVRDSEEERIQRELETGLEERMEVFDRAVPGDLGPDEKKQISEAIQRIKDLPAEQLEIKDVFVQLIANSLRIKILIDRAKLQLTAIELSENPSVEAAVAARGVLREVLLENLGRSEVRESVVKTLLGMPLDMKAVIAGFGFGYASIGFLLVQNWIGAGISTGLMLTSLGVARVEQARSEREHAREIESREERIRARSEVRETETVSRLNGLLADTGVQSLPILAREIAALRDIASEGDLKGFGEGYDDLLNAVRQLRDKAPNDPTLMMIDRQLILANSAFVATRSEMRQDFLKWGVVSALALTVVVGIFIGMARYVGWRDQQLQIAVRSLERTAAQELQISEEASQQLLPAIMNGYRNWLRENDLQDSKDNYQRFLSTAIRNYLNSEASQELSDQQLQQLEQTQREIDARSEMRDSFNPELSARELLEAARNASSVVMELHPLVEPLTEVERNHVYSKLVSMRASILESSRTQEALQRAMHAVQSAPAPAPSELSEEVVLPVQESLMREFLDRLNNTGDLLEQRKALTHLVGMVVIADKGEQAAKKREIFHRLFDDPKPGPMTQKAIDFFLITVWEQIKGEDGLLKYGFSVDVENNTLIVTRVPVVIDTPQGVLSFIRGESKLVEQPVTPIAPALKPKAEAVEELKKQEELTDEAVTGLKSRTTKEAEDAFRRLSLIAQTTFLSNLKKILKDAWAAGWRGDSTDLFYGMTFDKKADAFVVHIGPLSKGSLLEKTIKPLRSPVIRPKAARSEARVIDRDIFTERMDAIQLDQEAVADALALLREGRDPVRVAETVGEKYGLNETGVSTLARQIILSQVRSEVRVELDRSFIDAWQADQGDWILVLEDKQDFWDIFRGFLEPLEGFGAVEFVPGVQNAIDLLKIEMLVNGRPAVILTDNSMPPGPTGSEFVKALQAAGLSTEQVVMMTNQDERARDGYAKVLQIPVLDKLDLDGIQAAVTARRSELRTIDQDIFAERMDAIRLDQEAVADALALLREGRDPVRVAETIGDKYGLNETGVSTLARQIILSQVSRSEVRDDLLRKGLLSVLALTAVAGIFMGAARYVGWRDERVEAAVRNLERTAAQELQISDEASQRLLPAIMNGYRDWLFENDLQDSTENYRKFLIVAPGHLGREALRELRDEQREQAEQADLEAAARSEVRDETPAYIRDNLILLTPENLERVKNELSGKVQRHLERGADRGAFIKVETDIDNSEIARAVWKADYFSDLPGEEQNYLANELLLAVIMPENPADRDMVMQFIQAYQPKPVGIVPADREGIQPPMNPVALSQAVDEARQALLGVPSRLNVALSPDATKLEIRVSSNDEPVLVLDATFVMALSVDSGAIVIDHLVDGVTPQRVGIPADIDLTALEPGTNIIPEALIVKDAFRSEIRPVERLNVLIENARAAEQLELAEDIVKLRDAAIQNDLQKFQTVFDQLQTVLGIRRDNRLTDVFLLSTQRQLFLAASEMGITMPAPAPVRSEARVSFGEVRELIMADQQTPERIIFEDEMFLFFDDEVAGQLTVEMEDNGTDVGSIVIGLADDGSLAFVAPSINWDDRITKIAEADIKSRGESVRDWLSTLEGQVMTENTLRESLTVAGFERSEMRAPSAQVEAFKNGLAMITSNRAVMPVDMVVEAEEFLEMLDQDPKNEQVLRETRELLQEARKFRSEIRSVDAMINEVSEAIRVREAQIKADLEQASQEDLVITAHGHHPVLAEVNQLKLILADMNAAKTRVMQGVPGQTQRFGAQAEVNVTQLATTIQSLYGSVTDILARSEVRDTATLRDMTWDLRTQDIQDKLTQEAYDLLQATNFSEVIPAGAPRTNDVALKVAFLTHGILDLVEKDVNQAVAQLQTLANALGAEAMAAVLSVLPADRTLPVTKLAGDVVQFVTTEDIESQFAAVKVMLALNSGQRYIFVIPGDDRAGAADIRNGYEAWAAGVVAKGIRIPDLATRFSVVTEEEFSKSPASVVSPNKIVAVSKSARDVFDRKLLENLDVQALVIGLDYDMMNRVNNPAAHTGLVKLSQKVTDRAKYASASDVVANAEALLEDLPEFEQKNGKIAITDFSLQSVAARIMVEFQAVMQTAISA